MSRPANKSRSVRAAGADNSSGQQAAAPTTKSALNQSSKGQQTAARKDETKLPLLTSNKTSMLMASEQRKPDEGTI